VALISVDDSNRLFKALARVLRAEGAHKITLTVGRADLPRVVIDRPVTADEAREIAAVLLADKGN
jgi:hypothetical protein